MSDLSDLGVSLVPVGILDDVAQYTIMVILYVAGPPLIGDCSLTPENPDDPLIALETKFNFQCSSPSVDEGVIKYSVFCNMSAEPEFDRDYELYSDFYPDGTNIVIPVELCAAYVMLENGYNMNSTKDIGKFVLESPVIPPPTNGTDPFHILTTIEYQLENIDSLVDGNVITAIKKTVFLATAAATIDALLIDNFTSEFQERSSEVLTKISQKLLNMTDEVFDPLFEIYFKNAAQYILEVADSLMQLQNETKPNVTDGGYNPQVTSEVQTTISTVAEAAMERTDLGQLYNLSTTNIGVTIWKSDSNDTIGQSITSKDVELIIPEGVGDGVMSVTAVATTMNPQPDAILEHATNFINVSIDGPGVEEQDFPLIYNFPRNTKVVDEPGSPHRIVFELVGKAHCVRYDSLKKLYGWRVISNSATMSIEIPTGGRAFISVNTNASLYIDGEIHTVYLQINNKTLGKLCWPVLDEVTIGNIKLIRAITSENEEELWVENGRSENTLVGLKFKISFTKLMLLSTPLKCDATLAREGKIIYPVNTTVKLLQMLGQCLVYDETVRKYVTDKRCAVFPGKDNIRCECVGSSVRTAVDAPVTNNIVFTALKIDLNENPAPLIFTVTLACVFILLCFWGAIHDIRCKRKLLPLTDSKKADHPIKYNVFVYISKFRHSRGKRNTRFSLTLRGSFGVSVTNTYNSPGVSHGAMLHLVHHSDQLLGSIRKVVLIPQDKSIKWHVSRVVVSDAVEQDVAVFLFNCWLLGEATSRSRTSKKERNCWRENVFVKVMVDIMDGIPFLMLFLPGGVQERKLDHMLTYALGLMIWAVLQLWFYKAVHPLYKPDDCIQGSDSTSQEAANSVLRLLFNYFLMTLSTILIEGAIGVSLMYKEKKSKESRSYRVRGFLPLPHWFRLVVRGFATFMMLIIISFLTLMSYMFTKAEFNTWLTNMGEAFAFQIASKSLEKIVKGTASYFIYLPSPDKFNERMVNPEGMRVMCPECHVCPQVLHQHFRSHFSLPQPSPWLIGTQSSSLFNV